MLHDGGRDHRHDGGRDHRDDGEPATGCLMGLLLSLAMAALVMLAMLLLGAVIGPWLGAVQL